MYVNGMLAPEGNANLVLDIRNSDRGPLQLHAERLAASWNPDRARAIGRHMSHPRFQVAAGL